MFFVLHYFGWDDLIKYVTSTALSQIKQSLRLSLGEENWNVQML
jgi:hypothetical protein